MRRTARPPSRRRWRSVCAPRALGSSTGMSYALSFDESPAEAVERVRREQLQAAAEGLQEDPTDPEAIHDARKRIKKTRALLRLARPVMKRKAFRARNHALRDAGRALSAARDAEVLAQTVNDLADRYPGRAQY